MISLFSIFLTNVEKPDEERESAIKQSEVFHPKSTA